MTDAQAAASLNTENRTVRLPIPTLDLLELAASVGVLSGIRNLASNTVSPQQSAAIALDNHLSDVDAYIDVDRFEAWFDGLVTAGVLTAGQKNFVMALADQTVSRATELGLGLVRAYDIAKVR